MGKVNAKGRTKFTPYIRLHRGVTNSKAWRSLSCEARCIILEVWARHNGQNNGRIPLSVNEARKKLRIGSRKIAVGFKDAQERGFLVAHARGSFDWKAGAGEGRATEWEITTEPCDGNPAKALYRDWKVQNAVTAVVTAGNHSSDRSAESVSQKSRNGNYSGYRFTDIRPTNGHHCSDTSIIP